jgi:hypothetical protein
VVAAEVAAVSVLGWSFSAAFDVVAAEEEMEEDKGAAGSADTDATVGATTSGDEGERGDDGEEESALANLVILWLAMRAGLWRAALHVRHSSTAQSWQLCVATAESHTLHSSGAGSRFFGVQIAGASGGAGADGVANGGAAGTGAAEVAATVCDVVGPSPVAGSEDDKSDEGL